MSSCSICINHSDGVILTRVKACYNNVGQVTSMTSIVDGSDFVNAGIQSDIEAYVKGETIPSGATVTTRVSCTLSTSTVPYEICLTDGVALQAQVSILQLEDTELGEILGVVRAKVLESVNASLPVDSIFSVLGGTLSYTSGNAELGDLAVTVNGVALTQADCVECLSC